MASLCWFISQIASFNVVLKRPSSGIHHGTYVFLLLRSPQPTCSIVAGSKISSRRFGRGLPCTAPLIQHIASLAPPPTTPYGPLQVCSLSVSAYSSMHPIDAGITMRHSRLTRTFTLALVLSCPASPLPVQDVERSVKFQAHKVGFPMFWAIVKVTNASR